jgi:hypothetical protein
MQREELLRLDAAATRSLDDVAATDADLAAALRSTAAEQVREVVQARFATASDELRAALAGMDLGVPTARGLRDELVSRLEDAGTDEDLLEQARAATTALTPEEDALTRLRADEPIRDNPVFGRLLEQARTQRLASIAPVPDVATDAVIARVATAEHLDNAASELEVAPRALASVASEAYAVLDEAANALLAGMRFRHPDEARWTATIEPFEARLRNARRDALVERLIRSAGAGYRDRGDLSNSYLIDVEVDGILTTSPLVSAIGSVQRYVHRVQMNLEQTADGSIRVPPALVRPAECSWRRHRVQSSASIIARSAIRQRRRAGVRRPRRSLRAGRWAPARLRRSPGRPSGNSGRQFPRVADRPCRDRAAGCR